MSKDASSECPPRIPTYFNGIVDVASSAGIGELSVKDYDNILEFPDIRYDQTLDNDP